MEEHFVTLRNQYIPDEVRVVFVLESPPLGHGYFYDPRGRVSEVLFRAFMKLLDFEPGNKEEGLQKLAGKGWLLINPIYIPINKLPDREADKLILDNYVNFRNDLMNVLEEKKSIPVILVKANILKLLSTPLTRDGFNVRNNGILIPFPLHYHLNRFLITTRKLLSNLDS